MARVLVIDDEAPIRLLCRVNLEAEGMEVLEASSGLEGRYPAVRGLAFASPGTGWAVTGRSAGTDAFNEAEQEGTRLEVTSVDPAERVTQAMPLDQYVVSFD